MAKIHAVKAQGVKTPGVVVREPDYSQLTDEDRAQLVKTQMNLRASIAHIRAHGQAMNGAIMCTNSLVDTDHIETELLAVLKETQIALSQVRKLKLITV